MGEGALAAEGLAFEAWAAVMARKTYKQLVTDFMRGRYQDIRYHTSYTGVRVDISSDGGSVIVFRFVHSSRFSSLKDSVVVSLADPLCEIKVREAVGSHCPEAVGRFWPGLDGFLRGNSGEGLGHEEVEG